MKHLVKWLIFVLAVFLMNQAARAVEIGDIPPEVELKEKLGDGWMESLGAAKSYRGRSMSFFTWTLMKKIRTMMPAKLWTERSFPATSFNRLESLIWQPPGFQMLPFLPPLNINRSAIPKPFMCGITRECW